METDTILTVINDGNFDNVLSGIQEAAPDAWLTDFGETQDRAEFFSRISTIEEDYIITHDIGGFAEINHRFLCVTESLSRLSAIQNLYESIRERYNGSRMDILVLAKGKANGEVREWLEGIGEYGLRVFYVSRELLRSDDDIKRLTANIINNGLTDADLRDGLYLVRAGSGYMGEFPLFYELAYRRLQESDDTPLPVTIEGLREFTKSFTERKTEELDETDFRYIIWDSERHGQYPSANAYQDNEPFIINVKKFIADNCSAEFNQFMSKNQQKDGYFCNLIFNEYNHALGSFKSVIGRKRIDGMANILRLLKSVKAEAQAERAGLAGAAAPPPGVSEKNNIWNYSRYLYEHLFKKMIGSEKLSCELAFIEALINDLDKMVSRESVNLEGFNKMIAEKRGRSRSSFASAMYDGIDRLFKCNPEAETFLNKCINEQINSNAISGKELTSGRALFSETVERFRAALQDKINIVFEQDNPESEIQKDINAFADNLLKEKLRLLITSHTYDSLRNILFDEGAEYSSNKEFGGYESIPAKILYHDENTYDVFEYYRVDYTKEAVMDTLCKII